MARSGPKTVFQELRRRRVFSVIALYAACAWVVIEVGDLVIDSGMITALTTRDLLVLAIIGFPLSLVAGWFYDITREGVVRTAPAEADESFDGALRPRDYGLFALLLGAWLAVYLVVPAPQRETLPAEDFNLTAQKVVAEKSIAILPFESRGDTDSSHLAFGIQDDLIVHLGRVRDMTLIAQSSVSQIEPGTPDDAVAEKLGVAYVMHGSVERMLNQIRVNVMLIDVAGNRLAWSNQFDRELTMANLFDIRKEIALSVTEELRAVVSPEEEARVVGRMPTENMMAWQLYLRGRQLFDRRTKEDLERSLQLYRRALELDPELALAWVGIADSARMMTISLYMDLDEGTDLMREALDRALALDDELGEAYASLSVVYKREGRAEEREEACRTALALSPNYALGHLWCMDVWQKQPDGPEDRLDALNRLAKMDPLSDIHQLNIALALWDRNRVDEARQQFELVVNVFPENFHGYRWYGRLETATGNLAHGVELFRRAYELNPAYLHTMVDLFYAYLALGELDRARSVSENAMEHPAAAGRADVLTVEVEMQFDLVRGDWATAIRRYEESGSPEGSILTWYAHAQMAAGDLQAARSAWFRGQPHFIDPENTNALLNADLGCITAGLLIETGDTERGRELAEKAHERFESGQGTDIWVCHLLEGRYDEALAYYEQLVDKGYIAWWWQDRLFSWWNPVRGGSRFRTLDERVERLISEQGELLHRVDQASRVP